MGVREAAAPPAVGLGCCNTPGEQVLERVEENEGRIEQTRGPREVRGAAALRGGVSGVGRSPGELFEDCGGAPR